MSTKAPRLQRTRCSAKSLLRRHNSFSYKELPFHGVEDGLCVKITLSGVHWRTGIEPDKSGYRRAGGIRLAWVLVVY